MESFQFEGYTEVHANTIYTRETQIEVPELQVAGRTPQGIAVNQIGSHMEDATEVLAISRYVTPNQNQVVAKFKELAKEVYDLHEFYAGNMEALKQKDPITQMLFAIGPSMLRHAYTGHEQMYENLVNPHLPSDDSVQQYIRMESGIVIGPAKDSVKSVDDYFDALTNPVSQFGGIEDSMVALGYKQADIGTRQKLILEAANSQVPSKADLETLARHRVLKSKSLLVDVPNDEAYVALTGNLIDICEDLGLFTVINLHDVSSAFVLPRVIPIVEELYGFAQKQAQMAAQQRQAQMSGMPGMGMPQGMPPGGFKLKLPGQDD